MILPAQKIEELCKFQGLVTPFHDRTEWWGMTYGLSAAGYDIRIAQDVELLGQGFSLASTMEHFDIPRHILGIVHDKSTWARRGIAVQNTVFEPGWRGYATLEISNHSSKPVKIEAGMPIAQIVFHLLAEPTRQPYEGKYQDQLAGPQEAILEGKSNGWDLPPE
jgi:dCTP deaminase